MIVLKGDVSIKGIVKCMINAESGKEHYVKGKLSKFPKPTNIVEVRGIKYEIHNNTGFIVTNKTPHPIMSTDNVLDIFTKYDVGRMFEKHAPITYTNFAVVKVIPKTDDIKLGKHKITQICGRRLISYSDFTSVSKATIKNARFTWIFITPSQFNNLKSYPLEIINCTIYLDDKDKLTIQDFGTAQSFSQALFKAYAGKNKFDFQIFPNCVSFVHRELGGTVGQMENINENQIFSLDYDKNIFSTSTDFCTHCKVPLYCEFYGTATKKDEKLTPYCIFCTHDAKHRIHKKYRYILRFKHPLSKIDVIEKYVLDEHKKEIMMYFISIQTNKVMTTSDTEFTITYKNGSSRTLHLVITDYIRDKIPDINPIDEWVQIIELREVNVSIDVDSEHK
jgi:hypothetical protein